MIKKMSANWLKPDITLRATMDRELGEYMELTRPFAAHELLVRRAHSVEECVWTVERGTSYAPDDGVTRALATKTAKAATRARLALESRSFVDDRGVPTLLDAPPPPEGVVGAPAKRGPALPRPAEYDVRAHPLYSELRRSVGREDVTLTQSGVYSITLLPAMDTMFVYALKKVIVDMAPPSAQPPPQWANHDLRLKLLDPVDPMDEPAFERAVRMRATIGEQRVVLGVLHNFLCDMLNSFGNERSRLKTMIDARTRDRPNAQAAARISELEEAADATIRQAVEFANGRLRAISDVTTLLVIRENKITIEK